MLELAFKAVSMIFAISAVATGGQALMDPVGFAKGFGIPIAGRAAGDRRKLSAERKEGGGEVAAANAGSMQSHKASIVAQNYVSLMGVRQLATGVTLFTFAYQDKWNEVATILCILGFLVAGTDGIYLSRFGSLSLGCFHAIPGALIALLSAAFLWSSA